MTRRAGQCVAALVGTVLWSAFAPAQAQVACEQTFAEVFRAVAPSVVTVFALSIDPFSLTDRVLTGVGSGVVIDDTGHILTNSHLAYGSSYLSVTLADKSVHDARLVGADPILDLAILTFDGDVRPPAARLGRSADLDIAADVLVTGNSFGLGPTTTKGIVSGLNRIVPRSPMSRLAPLIQTDAPINPGNSGGPLVNRCSEVVGINTMFLEAGENIGFAVPIDMARAVMPQLIEQGRVIRPWHGINGRLVDLRLKMFIRAVLVPGFLVETVEPGSPAERIGLRGGSVPVRIGPQEYLLGGDIITEVSGEPLNSMETVVRIVRDLRVGDHVALRYFRAGSYHEAEVELPERPVLPADIGRYGDRRARDR